MGEYERILGGVYPIYWQFHWHRTLCESRCDSSTAPNPCHCWLAGLEAGVGIEPTDRSFAGWKRGFQPVYAFSWSCIEDFDRQSFTWFLQFCKHRETSVNFEQGEYHSEYHRDSVLLLLVAAELQSSSGHSELDDAAIAWLKAHWRYTPAMQSGKAVPSNTSVVVTFRLDQVR